MSNDLSFKEKLARQAATSASAPVESSSPSPEIRIDMGATFSHPVRLARLLAAAGLGLASAHAAVGRLVNERTVTVDVPTADIARLLSDIRMLGLEASSRRKKAA